MIAVYKWVNGDWVHQYDIPSDWIRYIHPWTEDAPEGQFAYFAW